MSSLFLLTNISLIKKFTDMSKIFNSLEELSSLKNNSTEYSGKLADYQQKGSKHKDKRYSDLKLNTYQNLLYKRALYGLSMYTEEELKTMHWERKRRIRRVNRRAQRIINVFKQERVNSLCDQLYKKFCFNSKLAKDLFSLEKSIVDPNIINTLELQTLKITKNDVIQRLIKEGILPKNFYELKEAA